MPVKKQETKHADPARGGITSWVTGAFRAVGALVGLGRGAPQQAEPEPTQLDAPTLPAVRPAATVEPAVKATKTSPREAGPRVVLFDAEENASIIARDGEMRQAFVNADRREELEQPDSRYVDLVDVYANGTDFRVANVSDVDPQWQASFLRQWSRPFEADAGKPSVCSESEFASRWATFSQGQLDGLDFANVFVAGGCVLACLLNQEDAAGGFKGSDIDLFLYGLSDAEGEAKLREILEVVGRNREAQNGAKPEVVRTAHAVTIIGAYPFRHIQVVLRMYASPAEVLLGFDVDACTVGYDGGSKRVYATKRARRSLNKRVNVVDLTRRSLTYEVRLHKYAKRGFAVLVPDLDIGRLDFEKFLKSPVVSLNGLAKLIALHFHENQSVSRYLDRERSKEATLLGSKYRRRFGGRRVMRRDRIRQRLEQRGYRYTGSVGRPSRDDWHRDVAVEGKSDYDNVLLPWGPAWHNWNVAAYMIKKDKAHVFSSKTRSHIALVGVDAVFSGKASWCDDSWTDNNSAQPAASDVRGNVHTVSGRITFLRENPGTQLMTGSFHPISDDQYYASVPMVSQGRPVKELETVYAKANGGGQSVAAAVGGLFAPQKVAVRASLPQKTKLAQKAPRAAAAAHKSPMLFGATSGSVASPAAQPVPMPVQMPTPKAANATPVGTNSLLVVKFGPVPADVPKRLVAFDLDNTLIKTKSGATFAKNQSDWMWLDPSIPARLRVLHDDGVTLAVFTNQLDQNRNMFELKLRMIFEDNLKGVAVVCIAALKADHYRKPLPGMASYFWTNIATEASMTRSAVASRMPALYVGDAAGRKADFSNSDRGFAINAKMEFATPEEFFGLPHGVDAAVPSGLTKEQEEMRELIQNSSGAEDIVSRLLLTRKSGVEMLLMIGMPATGKSTISQRLEDHGYVRVNRDTLGTMPRCLELGFTALSAGSSVVIDNTNYNAEQRRPFIQLAQRFGVPVRVVVLQFPRWYARQMNKTRALFTGGEPIPEAALLRISAQSQPPLPEEGIDEVIVVDSPTPKFRNKLEELLAVGES